MSIEFKHNTTDATELCPAQIQSELLMMWEVLLAIANSHLRNHGGWFPFSVCVFTNGSVYLRDPFNGGQYLKVEEKVDAVVEDCANQATQRDVKLLGYCYPSCLDDKETINIYLEHRDGFRLRRILWNLKVDNLDYQDFKDCAFGSHYDLFGIGCRDAFPAPE